MVHPILMPKPGQMTEECTIVAWHKREGDLVVKGDVLFEIETDKANMDVEAFDDGVLLRIVAKAGETVAVNTLCGYVGYRGEDLPEATATASDQAARLATPAVASDTILAADVSVESPPKADGSSTPGGATAPRTGGPISPRAARLAAERGIDARTISGTGPGGRIVERDVHAMTAPASPPPSATPIPVAPATARPVVATPTGISPGIEPEALELAARELIGSLGVLGSGPGGRITLTDVQRGLAERPQPLSRMRQAIARRLTESFTTIPHFAVTVIVDMTGALRLREELKAGGTVYSVTDLVAVAVVRTLGEYLIVNGRTDGTSVWLRRRVDLGLAVALDAGLVVPVIPNAERMRLPELHERAAALADGARAGTLPVDNLSGSTFTISNMGMLGVEHFTAIINPGEAAILAVASVVPSPAVFDGGIGIRQLMKITLSADHRLVDGAVAAAFLNAVRRRLEDEAGLRAEAEPSTRA